MPPESGLENNFYIDFTKRNETQMNELTTKLSLLTPKEYESIQSIVDILSEHR